MSTQPNFLAQQEEESLGAGLIEDLRIVFAATMSPAPLGGPAPEKVSVPPLQRVDEFEYVRAGALGPVNDTKGASRDLLARVSAGIVNPPAKPTKDGC